MSINMPNDGTQAQAPAAPTQQAAPSPSYSARVTDVPLPSAMFDRNTPPLTATPDAEAMKAFTEAVRTFTGGVADQYDMQVVLVNKNEATELFVSSIVLVVSHKADKNQRAAFHTLLLADTADTLPTNNIQIQGQNVEVQFVVGDAYDAEYKSAVFAALRRAFPMINPDNILEAEGEVVPRGYDFKNLELVRRTLANGLSAAGTILNVNTPGFVDYSLTGRARDLNSVAKLMFDQPSASNSVGEVVRTDIVVEYSEVKNQQSGRQDQVRRSLNGSERQKLVFSMGGFMDLVWEPANQNQQINPYAQAVQPQFQANQHLYTPRVVITKLDAPLLNTLPGQLLGLTTILTLRDNGNWIGSFHRPHMSATEFDPRDIGAIGIEANMERNPSGFGARFDTRSETFTKPLLAAMVQTFIRPELTISMDVPECGPETWLTSVFLAAARGSKQANDEIAAAATLLTNGEFQKLWQGGLTVINDNNRIHMGSYTDKAGVRHDIREVDHLCVLNFLGERDPTAVRDFSDTYARVEYPLELRLAHRRRIIESVTGTNVVYTGFADRITFSGKFLETLAQAVINTGLQIRPITPFQDMSGQPRASANWIDGGRLSANATGLFNRNYGQAVAVGPQAGSFGRWSN